MQLIYVLCPEEMLVFVIFCSRILFSKDSCHTNRFIDLQRGSVDWFLLAFTDSNFRTERFYPSVHLVWIWHKWEVVFWGSYVKITSKDKFTSCIHGNVFFSFFFSFFSFFFWNLWMKNNIWLITIMLMTITATTI